MIKIPRIESIEVGMCCKTCKYFTHGQRISSRCSINNIYTTDECFCKKYCKELKPSIKGFINTVEKQNILNFVKKYLLENKIIIPIDMDDFLKTVPSSWKKEVKYYCENYIKSSFFTVTAIVDDSYYIKEHLIGAININCYQDAENLTTSENVLYLAGSTITMAIAAYIYEKYK